MSVVGTMALLGDRPSRCSPSSAFAVVELRPLPRHGMGRRSSATPVLVDHLTPIQLALMAAGGVAYTVGVPILLLRRPDPWPAVFGYHEIWHGFTVLAAALHFGAVALVGYQRHRPPGAVGAEQGSEVAGALVRSTAAASWLPIADAYSWRSMRRKMPNGVGEWSSGSGGPVRTRGRNGALGSWRGSRPRRRRRPRRCAAGRRNPS